MGGETGGVSNNATSSARLFIRPRLTAPPETFQSGNSAITPARSPAFSLRNRSLRRHCGTPTLYTNDTNAANSFSLSGTWTASSTAWIVSCTARSIRNNCWASVRVTVSAYPCAKISACVPCSPAPAAKVCATLASIPTDTRSPATLCWVRYRMSYPGPSVTPLLPPGQCVCSDPGSASCWYRNSTPAGERPRSAFGFGTCVRSSGIYRASTTGATTSHPNSRSVPTGSSVAAIMVWNDTGSSSGTSAARSPMESSPGLYSSNGGARFHRSRGPCVCP